MPRTVYIMNTYEEHGPDDMYATLDPSNLPAMLEEYGLPNSDGPGRELMKERRALARFMSGNPLEDIRGGLSDGWGGIQVHMIELYEDVSEGERAAQRESRLADFNRKRARQLRFMLARPALPFTFPKQDFEAACRGAKEQELAELTSWLVDYCQRTGTTDLLEAG